MTKLNKRNFADLGQAFPKVDAATVHDYQDNLKYFKREIRRMEASITWINDHNSVIDYLVSCPSA